VSSLEDLLASLLDAVPPGVGDAGAGIRVEVELIELALPIEARIARDGRFLAGVPRGQVATGFDPPHGALALVLVRGDA
jgi:hypothetical protein